MKASDIDMQDLALVYDDEYGPDYVAGILASEFPALDTDTNYNKVLGMLKEAKKIILLTFWRIASLNLVL